MADTQPTNPATPEQHEEVGLRDIRFNTTKFGLPAPFLGIIVGDTETPSTFSEKDQWLYEVRPVRFSLQGAGTYKQWASPADTERSMMAVIIAHMRKYLQPEITAKVGTPGDGNLIGAVAYFQRIPAKKFGLQSNRDLLLPIKRADATEIAEAYALPTLEASQAGSAPAPSVVAPEFAWGEMRVREATAILDGKTRKDVMAGAMACEDEELRQELISGRAADKLVELGLGAMDGPVFRGA